MLLPKKDIVKLVIYLVYLGVCVYIFKFAIDK